MMGGWRLFRRRATVEDERVVAAFAIYFSRATGTSNDRPDSTEKPAGTAVFPATTAEGGGGGGEKER